MRRRSRVRRGLKWVGLALCAAALGLWVFSMEFFVLHGPYPMMDHGVLFAMTRGSALMEAQPGADCYYGGSGMFRSKSRDGPLWVPECTWSRGGHKYLRVPLWMPVLTLALPTGFLWWRDRRFPKGYCQTCGYDLTGDVSGVCPECGEKIVGQVEDLPRPSSRNEP